MTAGPAPPPDPPATAKLRYQLPPPPGCAIGRYIDREDLGDVADETEACEVAMRDARALAPEASLHTHGFELFPSWPSAVQDFGDNQEVEAKYHEEVRNLVKKVSGASAVYVFDHTVRESGATSLNATQGRATAATVSRVHCDYTAEGAPRRLAQLGQQGIFSHLKQRTLTAGEVEGLAKKRFAFVNVWRSIDGEHPVMQHPLAVCDERSVPKDDVLLYELRFPDRTGENYSLKFNPKHEWFYYPRMTKDECLVFKVFDKEAGERPRFVFHTAFDDPLTPQGGEAVPPRKSIEVRTVAFFDDEEDEEGEGVEEKQVGGKGGAGGPLTFFDMKHSNNAARIRLWRDFMPAHVKEQVKVVTLTYPELKTEDFARVNPLKKVPALRRSDGATVFESPVILSYLEDKFGGSGSSSTSNGSFSSSSSASCFLPPTPERRQLMNLQIRVHDLYVASPNCTAPGFTHSQGAMYLSTAWHGADRGMTVEDRAAKVAELWKQLTWLEQSLAVSEEEGGRGLVGPCGHPPSFLTGPHLSLSDFTWFPTVLFMEFLLPRVLGWSDHLFEASSDVSSASCFPHLAQWYTYCRGLELAHPEGAVQDQDAAGVRLQARRPFEETRQDIWSYWEEMEAAGQFEPIKAEIAAAPEHKWVYP